MYTQRKKDRRSFGRKASFPLKTSGGALVGKDRRSIPDRRLGNMHLEAIVVADHRYSEYFADDSEGCWISIILQNNLNYQRQRTKDAFAMTSQAERQTSSLDQSCLICGQLTLLTILSKLVMALVMSIVLKIIILWAASRLRLEKYQGRFLIRALKTANIFLSHLCALLGLLDLWLLS